MKIAAFRTHATQLSVAIVMTLGVLIASRGAFGIQEAALSVLNGLSLVGLLALGISVTMIAGELDLSAASVATLAGIVCIKSESLGVFGSTVVVLGVGVAIGLIQGVIIAKTRINSMVLTVATLNILLGVCYVVTGGSPVALTNYTLSDPLLIRYGGLLTIPAMIAIAAFLLIGVFLRNGRWGREIYAIGGARKESMAAGVSSSRPIIQAFGISGAAAGLAGGLVSLQAGSAGPTSFGALLLTAVAAALVGGISIYGGRGDALNVFLGVATISILTAWLANRGTADSLTQLVTGVLLFVVVAIEFLKARRGRSLAFAGR
ncbi:ABC transporter permease [Mycolicibacterium sp.]|uniref:ABC transporter permease n=1 Tax=Mycolicibacterium sp. TaxID=2320850 RepID=UPI0037C7F7E7